MNDRIPWLLSQIDTEEQVARMLHRDTCGSNNVERGSGCHCDWSIWDRMADLNAKRRIVDACVADLNQRGSGALEGLVDRPTWDVLTALASAFEHKPGYQERWRLT